MRNFALPAACVLALLFAFGSVRVLATESFRFDFNFGTGCCATWGHRFHKNMPADWSLQDDGLLLAAGQDDYYHSMAAFEVPEMAGENRGFVLRSDFTVSSYGSGGGDPRFGYVVLGEESPSGSDDGPVRQSVGEPLAAEGERFYHLQWAPNASGGAEIRIRRGMDGPVLAAEPWDGLTPSPGGSEIDYSSLSVNGTAIDRLGFTDSFAAGSGYFVDRDFEITNMPAELDGLPGIVTSNNERGNTFEDYITFDTNTGLTVYVAFDARNTAPPDWIADHYEVTNLLIGVSDTAGFYRVYRRVYEPGTVVLGGNNAEGASPDVADHSAYFVVLGPLPAEGVGVVYSAEAVGTYEESYDEWELRFTLADDDGYSATVEATDASPLVGGWFGFGARHRSQEDSGWKVGTFSLGSAPFMGVVPFAFEFGSDAGRVSDEPLRKNRPSGWQLAGNMVQLGAGLPVFHPSLATIQTSLRPPSDDFYARVEVTLGALDLNQAENRFGLAVLGDGASFNPADYASYYFLEWMPNPEGGPKIGIRYGAGGALIASADWNGARPATVGRQSHDDTRAADGSHRETTGGAEWSASGELASAISLTLEAVGVFDPDSGDLNLTFVVTDHNGFSETLDETIADPLQGNEFGYGAWHRTGEDPIWQVASFGVSSELPSEFRESGGFAAWRIERFQDDAENDAVAGPEANPSGDGVINFLKYAFDLDPLIPVQAGDMPTPVWRTEGLTLAYTERTDDDTVEYIVEVSRDMEDWNTEDVVEVSRAPDGENTERVEYRATFSPDEARSGFIRVRVKQND